jgi:acetyl esterase
VDEAVVRDLRAGARARSAERPKYPPVASATDIRQGGTQLRRYRITAHPDVTTVAVFAHGGYFVLGDLDLQDGYCRRLALALGGDVYSVDYALAPESVAAASVHDLVECVVFARVEAPDARIVLCGDSAGGTVAFLAAAQLRDDRSPVDALFLTNPNLDLSMSLFDRSAPQGPDPDLLSSATQAWAGPDPIGSGLSPLHTDMRSLPATMIAVGSLDALRPEAIAMHERLRGTAVRTALLVLDGVGHGFVGGSTALDAAARDEALATFATFMADG